MPRTALSGAGSNHRNKEFGLSTSLTINSAESLIAGYTSYVDATAIANDSMRGAPAISPAIVWAIGSSAPCGTGAGAIAGSAIGTIATGC
jgi:hypothetical protein